MPINVMYTGDPMNGTAGDDFMGGLSGPTGTTDNTMNGAGGDDVVLGDFSPFFYVPSNYSNGTREGAFIVDNSSVWTIDQNPLIGPSSPHASVVVSATVDEAEYFSFHADAGASIALDIDFGGSSPFGDQRDLVIEVYDGAGNEIGYDDDSTVDQGGLGSYGNGDQNSLDPYLTMSATYTGQYYVRVRTFGAGSGGVYSQPSTFLLNFSVSGHETGPASLVGNDTISGDAGDDQLFGQAGADTIEGGLGADLIDGGSGADVLNGGEGDDRIYGYSTDGDAENDLVHGDNGKDTIWSDGSGAFYGDAGDDLIYAGDGYPEQLDGGIGVDTLDLTKYVSGYDVNLASGETNFVTESFVNFENVRMGSGVNHVVGNAAANRIDLSDGNDTASGAGGNDVLLGGAGSDELNGGADNDRLDGGIDSDFMAGGAGNDIMIVDSADDTISELADQGTDTVEAWITFSLVGQYVEVLKLMGSALDGTGNGQANTLVGNALDNRLDGGAGADILQGGLGNDRYIVDNIADKVIELNGQGGDTVDSSVTFSLAGQYVEVLNLTGAAAINGTGNGLNNRITGNSGKNSLNGGDGNDRLDGGTGADTLRGGIGNDIFVVDQAGDVVLENDGEGTDTVEAYFSYSLAGQYIETLKLMGTGNFNGTGNGLSNTLTGNIGNNVLNGGGGIDTMAGGAGNDRYIVDNLFDGVTELVDQGFDTVESSVTFTLAGQYIEDLILTGAAAIDGTGNGQVNTLTGNTAANKLNGGGGNDVIHGGAGSDTLTGGAGADAYWFETALGASNVDKITDFLAMDDTIHLDRTIFSAIANGTLAANAFVIGTAAVDAFDRIVYDKPTGKIYYDADGVGGAAAVLFAQVNANTLLTNADFFGDP